MSKGNLIGLLVVVVLAAVVGDAPVGAQAKAVEIEMKDGKANVKGELTRQDALDVKGQKASFSKAYSVKLDAGVHHIEATSKAFDTYLRLEDSDGKQLAADDDGGEGTNARIVHRVARAGTFRIVVTSFEAGRVGTFMLSILSAGVARKDRRLALKDNKVEVEGTLTKDDPFDVVRQGARCKVYVLEMQAGKSYRIDLMSKAFDAYLRLEDPDGKQLALDDDGGEGTNSRINHRCTKAGAYRIVATHLIPDNVGDFTLSVVQVEAADKPIPLLLKDGKASVNAELNKDDPRDALRNTPCRVYLVKMEANRTYQIDHVARAFDAYLRLEDDTGKQLAANDDGGDGTNSRILFRPTKAGTYRVIPTTLNAASVGPFTLSIRASIPAQPIKPNTRIVLKDDRFEGEGTLTADDPADKVMVQSRCQTFPFEMKAGESYRIDLKSRSFDAYLRLEDPEGRQLAADDDGGGNNDSSINHHCTRNGTYRIIATTLGGGQIGTFTLGVVKSKPARVTLLEMKESKVSVEGDLAPEDARDPVRNTPCKIYLIELEAGQTCRIDHVSRAFDAFLRLEDPDGRQLVQDDDGGEGTNSRITYRAPRAGSYQIVATSLGGQMGAFTLTVTRMEVAKAVRIAMKDGKASVEAALMKTDPPDLARPGNVPMKYYSVEFEADRSYQIDLMSKAFDAMLRLEGSDGKTIATDDDGGEGTNSRITFRCLKKGTYQIAATTRGNLNINKGDFTLTVQQGPRLPEVVLKDGQGKVEGALTKDDPKDYGSASVTPSRAYAVKLEAGEVYNIDLSSRKFDSYLRLQGPDGATVAENDDGEDGLDASIVFRCTTAGTYYVVAKSVVNPNKFGAFALIVRQQK